jgi:resuscitation-promoting factor RpfA
MSNNEHRDPQNAGDEPALRRAWHQASDELPPPELDSAIIAAARKSVQGLDTGEKSARDSKRSRTWFMQWQPLAAAATVAGLAFILLQVMPRERDVAPSIRIEESVPRPATARPTTTEPPAAERAAAAPTAADAAVVEQKMSGQLAGRPNDDTPAGSANAAADQQAAISPEGDSANLVAPAPAAAAAPALEKRQRDESPMSTADWAARIVTLYESGDLAGATDALRAFRAVHPDADTYLPDSLRDWARSVK